jgi:hypothetical protein
MKSRLRASNKEKDMIRNYKAFSLALVAMFALSAFVAQGASAVPLTVNEGANGTTFYTGDQDGSLHSFSTPNGEVNCNTAVFSGTSTGASVNELTITPTYSNCKAFGFATAHVTHHGCNYTFTTPTTISANEVTWHPNNIHIICPAGKAITVTPTFLGSSVCTQSIGEQTPTGGHIIATNAGTNNPNGMDITLHVTLTGIHYTGTGGACGDANTHNDGVYNGTSTVRGFSNSNHITQRGITFSV